MRVCRRLARAVVLALGLVAAAPLTSAVAAAALTITSPLSGSSTRNDMPLISGTSEDLVDVVSVATFAGGKPVGAPVAVLAPALPSILGAWSTSMPVLLAQGVYTARATQVGLLGTAETLTTFTVHTTAPAPAGAASSGGGSESFAYELTPTPVPGTDGLGPGHLPLMRPFPIVHIAGVVTARGARIRLLAVKAPPGALVTVRCRRRGCRVKDQSRTVAATTASAKTGMSRLVFTRFERFLRADVVLQIVVTRGNVIGKFTSLRIFRGRKPERRNECVGPAAVNPFPCPR